MRKLIAAEILKRKKKGKQEEINERAEEEGENN